MRVSQAIVFVSDMKRSVAFYRDTLGLAWTEFATDGATLALHASEAGAGTPDDPHHMPGGRCRPGLCVRDLDAFHERMVERGVPCTQEPTSLRGVRLAQCLDGLAISVSEERRGQS